MTSMVLSNNGLSSFNWQQVVYDQIVQRKSEELQASADKLNAAMSGTADPYYENMANRFAATKASITNAEMAVKNGEKGTEKVRELLVTMRTAVCNYGESESKSNLRTQFDDAVDQINRTVDLYSKDYNPIGNVDQTLWTPNQISFTSDLMRPETTMSGTYAGADYYIAADDGTTWVPDPGASTITQYTSFSPSSPETSVKGEGYTSTRGGIKLNSYDAATGKISVTINPNHANSYPVTGTLKTGGIGVMQSWFYDLDTAEGRDAVLKSIAAAEAKLTGTDANLTMMSTTLKTASGKVEDAQNAFRETRSKAMQQTITENYEAQVKAQQELQILQNTFSTMSTQQANYATLFNSVKTSPLFDFTS